MPAVPSFAVDDGFWYEAIEEVDVGSLVRIPLGGRRVRGYVVETSERPPRPDLRPVGPKVMLPALFDRPLLDALLWAAHRYVAPVSVLLGRTAPPNLANRIGAVPRPPVFEEADHPLRSHAAAFARRQRRPPIAFLSRAGDWRWVEALAGPSLATSKSALVVAATGSEVRLIAAHARRHFAPQVVEVLPDATAAETTEAWSRCQAPGSLLIGTPRVAAWKIAGLAVAAAVEEGRRAMKDRQTPTLAVRDFLRTRAGLAGTGLVFAGPTPSLETVAGGPTIIRSRPRAWPPVQIVDRTQESETTGLLGSTALAAIRAVTQRDGRVFVFAHRRGYAPAVRCERCQTVRRCPRCGSRPDRGSTCPRCGASIGPCAKCGHDRFQPLGAGVGRVVEELRRTFGNRVAAAPEPATIQVGSEADLANLEMSDLAVAVDADGLILGTNYRSAEEALRILVRLVGKATVPKSRGLVQTWMPSHPVIKALSAGNPMEFLTAELENRHRLGLPPASQLLVVELRGDLPEDADKELRELGVAVMGPAMADDHHRWLLQGTDLGQARKRLRPLVQKWRDGGTVVRIDSDPLDL